MSTARSNYDSFLEQFVTSFFKWSIVFLFVLLLRASLLELILFEVDFLFYFWHGLFIVNYLVLICLLLRLLGL